MVKKLIGFMKKHRTGILVMMCVLSVVLMLGQTVSAAQINAESDNESGWESYWQMIYNSTDGLMSNQVTSVCQTDDGMIWFGTEEGLVAFDGKNYTEYGSFFLFDGVNSMIKTEDGVMWAATTKHGAAVNLGSRFHHFDDVFETSSNYATAMCECDGVIYVGTLRYMHTISPNEGYLVTDLSDNGFECVGSLAAGKDIVAGTTSNGEIFFIKDKRVFAYDTGKNFGQTKVCYADGFFVAGSQDGMIYIYSEDELNRLAAQNDNEASVEPALTVKTLQGNVINKLYYEKNNRLWVLCEKSIGYFEIKNSQSVKDAVMGEFKNCRFDDFESGFTDMTVDYQGNYWITSSDRGVLMLGKSFLADELAQADLSIDRVNAVYEDKDMLYIASDDGVAVINRSDKQIIDTELSEMFKGVRCPDVKEYQDMIAVAVYGKGVFFFDKNGELLYSLDEGSLVSARINSLCVIDDILMVLTDEGCSAVKKDKLLYSIDKNNYSGNIDFTCAIEPTAGSSSDKKLYIGSNGGGVYVVEDGQISGCIDENSNISSKNINALVSYGNGFFIATDKGINYFNGKKCVEISGLPQELKEMKCESVYVDERFLYVTGENSFYEVELAGLFPEEDVIADYRVLDSSSGFIHNVSEGGHVYFNGKEFFIPCGEKIYSVDKNYGTDDETQFRLLIQGVKQDGKTAMVSEENVVNIDSGTEKIEIFPSAIGYSVNDPYVRYALVGIDTEYIYVKKSELDTIEYEDVPGGEYSFIMQLVESQDKDAQPVAEVKLQIIKKKSLVENMWFKLLGMVGGFWVLMYFVFKDYKKNKIID